MAAVKVFRDADLRIVPHWVVISTLSVREVRNLGIFIVVYNPD